MPPLLKAKTAPRAWPTDVPGDIVVVAQWDEAASLLTLTRGVYTDQFHGLKRLS